VNIIVSDFDNTIFKKNYGLINDTVEYLEGLGLPVYIVTYRGSGQAEFIYDTLAGTELNVIGVGLADSRDKEPMRKVAIVKHIQETHNIIEALDDDEEVVVAYLHHGLNAKKVKS
jgi:hypothetical protein